MVAWVRVGSRPGDKIRPPGWSRYTVLAGVFVAATAFAYPLATRVSMPGSLTLATTAAVASGIVLLELWVVVLVLLLDLVLPRFWCNHICMQGGLLALLRIPWTLRVRYEQTRCRQDECSDECFGSCPIGIDPRSVGWFSGCTNCGECLSACARHGGALTWRFGGRHD